MGDPPMTGDALKRMQDNLLASAKERLLTRGQLPMVGFVVTLRKRVDKLFESGWGLEFLDPRECLRDANVDGLATLIVELSMDWKRLYHAVLNAFPETRKVLPPLLALGSAANIDDPYMRLMRAFLASTQLDEKDVAAATMRQICDRVEAFACIFQSEAWQCVGTLSEREEFPDNLADDARSVEVIISSMETHDFARMLTVPICRAPAPEAEERGAGKITGFGEALELVDTLEDGNSLQGRLVRFLRPLEVAL